jgi:hypothetical protein
MNKKITLFALAAKSDYWSASGLAGNFRSSASSVPAAKAPNPKPARVRKLRRSAICSSRPQGQ